MKQKKKAVRSDRFVVGWNLSRCNVVGKGARALIPFTIKQARWQLREYILCDGEPPTIYELVPLPTKPRKLGKVGK